MEETLKWQLTLVINAGSSSLKVSIIDLESDETLARVQYDKTSEVLTYKVGDKKNREEKISLSNSQSILDRMLVHLRDKKVGIIRTLDEISVIGHRVVNAGPELMHSFIATEENLKTFQDAMSFAPLHNPAHIECVKACQTLMPKTLQVLVPDTSFHATMPPKASTYAIPAEWRDIGIRVYGAHGSAHQYNTEWCQEHYGYENIISCHLGNGASICAIKDGKSVDTSMGFTPLDGLPMGTRSGHVDPGIIPRVMEKQNLTAQECLDALNKKSGFYGLTGGISDMREIWKAAKNNNEGAKLAIEKFVYEIRKYIWSYIGVLDGEVDAIVFSGGIGENDPYIVLRCVQNMEKLGVKLLSAPSITTSESEIKVFQIPVNEELVIAREAAKFLKSTSK